MFKKIEHWTLKQLDGRAGAKIIGVFALVHAMQSADLGSIGAMASMHQDSI